MDYAKTKNGFVKQIMEQFGTTMTVRIYERTLETLTEPPTDTYVDHFPIGVFLGFKDEEGIDGIIPVAGDKKAYFWFADDTTPLPGDEVIGPKGTVVRRIEAVETIDPIESGPIIVKALVR